MPEVILSDNVITWIAFSLAFTLGMLIKDIITQFIQGAMFRYFGQFNEGDHVVFDGCNATIVSIGIRYTKFGMLKDDSNIYWRFVPNDQIKYKSIEKLIYKHKDNT